MAVQPRLDTLAAATKEGWVEIELTDEDRSQMAEMLVAFFLDEFDETLSPFRAGAVVDFVMTKLAAPVYNRAISDAVAYMQERLADLDAQLYIAEE